VQQPASIANMQGSHQTRNFQSRASPSEVDPTLILTRPENPVSVSTRLEAYGTVAHFCVSSRTETAEPQWAAENRSAFRTSLILFLSLLLAVQSRCQQSSQTSISEGPKFDALIRAGSAQAFP